MPTMARVEQVFCRSAAWQSFAGRIVLPWAMPGHRLDGHVLEIGAGSGAMAAVLLRQHPGLRLTATDYDPAMAEHTRRRLAGYGERAEVRQADATALPFPDGTFDAVVSFLMLHHVIDWETALAEAARVLRPGGLLAGYDLIDHAPVRLLHRLEGSPHRMLTPARLRAVLAGLPLDGLRTRRDLLDVTLRFFARRI